MSDHRSDIDMVREAARRAREEALRLRSEARQLERRLREEAREERRREHERAHEERRESGQWDGGGPNVAEESFSLEGVRLVAIHQTAGQLIVRPCEAGEQPGVATSADRTTPNLSVRREGDTVSIDVRLAPGWLFRRRRGASTTVRLGAGLEAITANMGAGDVQLRGIAVPRMSVHTGAGVIGSVGSDGSLDLDVGAGKVTVYGHKGTVTCATGTGDATVDIAEAPPGTYRISVGIGRADLRLPAGLAVHARARSGLGRGRVEYPDAGEHAPISVSAESGIGEASVRSRAADAPASTPEPSGGSSRASRATTETRQSEELRILQLLEQGRISVAEAAELIAALHGSGHSSAEAR